MSPLHLPREQRYEYDTWYSERVICIVHLLGVFMLPPATSSSILSDFIFSAAALFVVRPAGSGSSVSFQKPRCHFPTCALPLLLWTWLQDPDMPRGKEAVDLARAGFRQVGEHR